MFVNEWKYVFIILILLAIFGATLVVLNEIKIKEQILEKRRIKREKKKNIKK